MKLKTTRFGEIDVDEGRVITFPLGVPGFPELKRYVLVEYKEPVKWLQSADDPDVAFIVTDPFVIFPDYSITIDDETESYLGIRESKDVVTLTILTVGNNAITANLKAPIIVNSATLKAVQVLLEDERYSFRAPLPPLPKTTETP
ncbi:MAG: flagellar assembly protein FliW [Nitrospirota bacterium]